MYMYMYMYMYLYMYLYNIYYSTCIPVHLHTCMIHVHEFTCINLDVHTFTCVHVYIMLHMCAGECVNVVFLCTTDTCMLMSINVNRI